MHFLRANLNFEWLAAMDDRGVQRLVEIRPRHGDVILETAGHRAPDVVNDAESGVTTTFCIGDNADSEEIVNLLEAAALALDFAMKRIKALAAGFKFGGDFVFHELGADGGLHVFEKGS